MVDAWWLAAAAGIGILVGFATCLVLALFIRKQPMEGRHWTGNTHTGAIRQLFHDADNRDDP